MKDTSTARGPTYISGLGDSSGCRQPSLDRGKGAEASGGGGEAAEHQPTGYVSCIGFDKKKMFRYNLVLETFCQACIKIVNG